MSWPPLLRTALLRTSLRKTLIAVSFFATFLTVAPTRACIENSGRMGEETIGNKPLNKLNYTNWPKIMPVANAKTRIYHTWVNGDERFYYRCDTDELNALLVSFGGLAIKPLEVVILPGPGSTTNFAGDRKFVFNCQMHLVSGIAAHMAGKQKGSTYWPLQPRITIRLNDQIQLANLTVPKNCTVVPLAELKQRFTDGLTSTAQEVRGWGIAFLSDVDPFDQDSLATVAGMLEDEVAWVGLNALSSIGKFGGKAKPYLPRLESIASGENASNAAAAKKAIEQIKVAIEKGGSIEAEKEEAVFREQLRQIDEYTTRRTAH